MAKTPAGSLSLTSGCSTAIHCQWKVREGYDPRNSEFGVLEIHIPVRCDNDLLTHLAHSNLGQPLQSSYIICAGRNLLPLPPDAIKPWIEWWYDSTQRSVELDAGLSRKLYLLYSRTSGQIIRSDIFHKRLEYCPGIDVIYSDLSPRQNIAGLPNEVAAGGEILLEDILRRTVCGLLLQPKPQAELSLFEEQIETMLKDRLSIPWTVDPTSNHRTIALLGGGVSYDWKRYYFENIAALGIRIVVLDNPGHWFEKFAKESAPPGLSFLPVALELDEKLPDRLVTVLQNHTVPVEAIVASDRYLLAAAVTAERLGLPTPPSNAIRTCTNKYLSRAGAPINNHHGILLHSIEDLTQRRNQLPPYPMIVKPSSGAGSLAVYKVEGDVSLEQAFHSVLKTGMDVVIEPYVQGPEVDVNIVLLNGQVILTEISDDFPSIGDNCESNSALGSFLETTNIFPSALPEAELDLLESEIAYRLRQLGFTTGIYHVEARVLNSSMEYYEHNGIVDLRPRRFTNAAGTASIALMEINPRSPGAPWVAGSAAAYGIDYHALELLSALRDDSRLRTLALPFRDAPSGWTEVAFIPIESGGIYHPISMFEDLTAKSPELTKHLRRWVCFYKDGDMVEDPTNGRFFWIAWYLVHSVKSREHLRFISTAIRNSLNFRIDQT